jgi:CheY-like chemotaxis protein
LATRAVTGSSRLELDEIRNAAQRAAALTQQLLAFSRRQVLAPKEVDLKLQTMLSRLIREDIALRFDPSPLPALVHIDPGQLEQVILNLVLNARDALPSGGEIRLEVSRVDHAVAGLPFNRSGAQGEYLRLRVIDNGIGMTPEVRARVFEPFFTTKEVGKGTGLGLASVYGIVRQSNGHILVESEPNAGTTFTLYLPARSAPNLERPADSSSDEAVSARGTILLVEDEHAVRRIVRQLLINQGYQVIEAATGLEACTIFEERSGQIDVLMTDVVMPEMNGPALAKQLMARRPGLRVLFTSGYADLPESSLDLDRPNVAFLGKPIQAGVLAAKLRELLASADPKTALLKS